MAVAGQGLVLYVKPELQRLRALVDAARARLAELEAGFTIEKAKVEAMKARLFARLRGRWMASLRRAMPATPQAHLFEWRFAHGVGMARRSDAIHLSRASRCGDGGGAGGEAGTHRRGSRRGEPALAEAGEAVSPRPRRARAGEAGDLSPADRRDQPREGPRRSGHAERRLAEDRRNGWGFILRQGWAALDFGEEREIAQLRRLWESIELEIIRMLEAGHALKESPDYELHWLTTQTPAFFDETVGRHVESLEKEVTLLESEAGELAKEIGELTGEAVPGIE